ncbi:ABC transporter ATP-binding protein [Camelliibacillus cellulosilyticus]|uniref:ABC transporter ATP-binding protein n=1 Tax=Camelliibacillus cellulosilyticus TaxID=2174486 RepID=A0ABV9GK66_9BACL
MSEIIRLAHVKKDFKGDGVVTMAVNNVSISFQKGEFTSIIGPSGSGKSTFLSLIGTLDQPTGGKILFDDQDVTKLSNKKLADFRFEEIGFIFQQFHLLPTLTALENVMAPLFARKVSYNKRERAEALLKDVGLEDKLSALPSQLSGGQQQRVAIARALVHHPHWILADEPTGNLDTESGQNVFELLRHLNKEKGLGVLFVTHDPGLARRADRMVTLKDGQIVADTAAVA